MASKSENPDSQDSYRLLLFVRKSTARANRAVQNVRQICEMHLQGAYQLETIDVCQNPGRVNEYQVVAVPTLIKQAPPPSKRIVGDLSAESELLAALDIFPQM